MKTTLLFFSLLVSVGSFGQLMDGTLVDENRKLTSTSSFVVSDKNEGIVFYELSVNRLGEVTAAKLLTEGTTINSTPTKMKVRSHVMNFTFTAGTYYPAFQNVRVKITVTKE
jgi:hypothetical protein